MNGRLKNWLEGDALVLALELTLIALLAVMLAHWTWAFFSPTRAATPLRSAPAGPVPMEIPAGLFAGSGVSLPAKPGAIRLLGVVSPRDGQSGQAVLRLEQGTSKVVAVGDALAAGVVLREVHPDHVVVERNGALERLKMERRAAVPDAQRARR